MRRSNVRSHTVLVVATLLARSGSLVSGRHKGRNGALWALNMAHEASIIFSRVPGKHAIPTNFPTCMTHYFL